MLQCDSLANRPFGLWMTPDHKHLLEMNPSSVATGFRSALLLFPFSSLIVLLLSTECQGNKPWLAQQHNRTDRTDRQQPMNTSLWPRHSLMYPKTHIPVINAASVRHYISATNQNPPPPQFQFLVSVSHKPKAHFLDACSYRAASIMRGWSWGGSLWALVEEYEL